MKTMKNPQGLTICRLSISGTTSKICIVLTAFPNFFLDIVQETYNTDYPIAFNQKKSPCRSVCFVIRLLLLYVNASGRKGSNGIHFWGLLSSHLLLPLALFHWLIICLRCNWTGYSLLQNQLPAPRKISRAVPGYQTSVHGHFRTENSSSPLHITYLQALKSFFDPHIIEISSFLLLY